MGKPAARIGDMHTCPMVTPGVPPVPHVGGPVSGPCVPTVLIGGQPAAVVGDMCVCVGPPDSIVLGSMGVLIGGKPAARMGDMTAHGGMIAVGLPTVLIGEMSPGAPPVVVPPVAMVNVQGTTDKGLGKAVNKLRQAIKNMAPEAAAVTAQKITLLEAAKNGTGLCEVCRKK